MIEGRERASWRFFRVCNNRLSGMCQTNIPYFFEPVICAHVCETMNDWFNRISRSKRTALENRPRNNFCGAKRKK